jgi:hypothetical protein
LDPLTYRLGVGEVAWLWRHRRKLSAAQAAEIRGLTRAAWTELEREWQYEAGCSLVTGWLDYGPTQVERLRLLRRRAAMLRGVGRNDLADRLGVSHVTYLKMERTADQRLVTWWSGPGYELVR